MDQSFIRTWGFRIVSEHRHHRPKQQRKDRHKMIDRDQLKSARPADIRRLAIFLGLRIDGYSDGQVLRLVMWRVSRGRITNTAWSTGYY